MADEIPSVAPPRVGGLGTLYGKRIARRLSREDRCDGYQGDGGSEEFVLHKYERHPRSSSARRAFNVAPMGLEIILGSSGSTNRPLLRS